MDPNIGKVIEYLITLFNQIVEILTWLLMLIYGNPFVMAGWIVVAMYHMRRKTQIRDKSKAMYYILLIPDVLGFIADVMANWTWAIIVLLDRPRFGVKGYSFKVEGFKGLLSRLGRELTISKHMERINDEWIDNANPSTRQKWGHLVASTVCRYLDMIDPSGYHCGGRRKKK